MLGAGELPEFPGQMRITRRSSQQDILGAAGCPKSRRNSAKIDSLLRQAWKSSRRSSSELLLWHQPSIDLVSVQGT